jgi:squalene monooxygenase
MRSPYPRTVDAAVVGAGPVGCAAALALVRAGAEVLLVEAKPSAARRLAGEWLHPPGLEVLRRLDVDVAGEQGHGFAVFPGGTAEPVLLPYADGKALSCEHEALVETMRLAVSAQPRITFVTGARVLELHGEQLTLARPGEPSRHVLAGRIVGADGRASVTRRAIGLPVGGTLVSATAGIVLEDAELPFEGFGHVLLGGPGTVLLYRLGPGRLRACVDVPGPAPRPREVARVLSERYGSAFPPSLAPAFRRALELGRIAWATNRHRSRTSPEDLGAGSLLLAGDAAGHYHPLTAVGMTLGLVDAERAAVATPEAYRRERARASRAPELLATSLYAAFTRSDTATAALRQAMLDLWADPRERERTMRLLSTEEARTAAFYRSFAKVLALTARGLAADSVRRRSAGVEGLAWWLRWLTASSVRPGAG